MGFPSSPDTTAAASVSAVPRNPNRPLTVGDFLSTPSGHDQQTSAILQSTQSGKRKSKGKLPQAKHPRRGFKTPVLPVEFDPSVSDSDSSVDFPPLIMPKAKSKSPASNPAAPAATAAAAESVDSSLDKTLGAIGNLLEETDQTEVMDTTEGKTPPPPPSPPPSPTFKSILKSQSSSSTIRPLSFQKTVSVSQYPESPQNPLLVPYQYPLSLPLKAGGKRNGDDDLDNPEGKRSRSEDEGAGSETETTVSAATTASRKADPKKVRVFRDDAPEGRMSEDLFDKYSAAVVEAILQDAIAGKLSDGQNTCLGQFSYDHRTSRGVIMLLDEADLALAKHYTSAVALEDESGNKVTFTAIGGAEIIRKHIHARVDRLPVKFKLDDPSPILEYVKVRLPFLKAEPFKLELEDFKLAESPLTRTDTKVLLKMEATDRLIEYLEANDWKIPLLGAYLPFEQPRKTGYESSLDRQSRRTKSPGPRGPRD